MVDLIDLQPGQRIRHTEFGEGVVVDAATDGFLRAFFSDGERQEQESHGRRFSADPSKSFVTLIPANNATVEHGWPTKLMLRRSSKVQRL